jgi:tRNA (guanine-N7-)-methyltransferase
MGLMFFDRASLGQEAFRAVFNEQGVSVQLKIGIDTGTALCKLALASPDELFVGVEIKPHQAREAYLRAKRLKIDNIVIINEEAAYFLASHCPAAAFSTVHIYFPTPYVAALKKLDRSLDHRLFVPKFVDELYRVVMPGGAVRIATDVAEYYRGIERLFHYSRWIRVNWSDLKIEKPADCLIGTPCELDYRSAGRQILAVELLRV